MLSGVGKLLVALIVLLIVGVGAYMLWQKTGSPSPEVACTQEAMMCPDGSYVGRTGPNCEFTACPQIQEPDVTASWNTAIATTTGLSFKYPSELGTTYIHIVDWPPQVQVLNDPFTCTEAGLENDRAGITEKVVVNNRTYCVTRESEGAAGSMYTNYAYATDRNGSTTIMTFSLRSVQCANYNDPEKTACETERAAFTISDTIDTIFESLR